MKTNNVRKGVLFLVVLMGLFLLAGCTGLGENALQNEIALQDSEYGWFDDLTDLYAQDREAWYDRLDQLLARNPEMLSMYLEEMAARNFHSRYTRVILAAYNHLSNQSYELVATALELGTARAWEEQSREMAQWNIDQAINPSEWGFNWFAGDPERIEYWFLYYANEIRENNPSQFYTSIVNVVFDIYQRNPNHDLFSTDLDVENLLLALADREADMLAAEERRILNELARLEREEEQAQREREDLARRRRLYEADFRRNWTGSHDAGFDRRLQHAMTQWDLRNDDQIAAQARAESVRRNQEQLEQERNAAAIAREIAGEVSAFWGDSNAPAAHPNHVRWVRDSQGRVIGEVRTTGTYLLTR